MLDNFIDIKSLGYDDPIDTDIQTYSPGNNLGLPRYRIHKGKLVLYISNSLINEFIQWGEIKDYCAKKVFETYITGNYEGLSASDAMNNGSYFETQCLGSGAGNKVTIDLPSIRGGKKSMPQKRIDEQVLMFKHLMRDMGMLILPDKSNVQVKAMKEWADNNYIDLIVFATGESDLITPYSHGGIVYDNIVVDLKLTGDITSTYGPYQWGDLKKRDMKQATLYSLLFDMPFAYWIFDYKSSVRENKFFFVNSDINHPNPELANNAKFRLRVLTEAFRKTINEIVFNFKNGWKENPSEDNCKKCPLKNCRYKFEIKVV